MSIASGVRAMLTRREIARQNFVNDLADWIGVDEAEKVTRLYLRERILRFDGIAYKVRHGAFLDRSSLKNAVRIAKREGI